MPDRHAVPGHCSNARQSEAALKSVELFAGAGGLAMGASFGGFQPVAIVEWDRYCCDTIRANQTRQVDPIAKWPELVEGDVREFEFDRFADKVDLVSGGPPCQPFSLGGKHRSHLDSRDMFPQAIRAVRIVRPKAFLFENVKGMKRIAFQAYFDYIRLQLTHPEIELLDDEEWADHLERLRRHDSQPDSQSLKYKVADRVLNAADFGIPQKRERVFFVGFRSDLGIDWEFPRESHSADALLWDKYRSKVYWAQHDVAQQDGNEREIARADRLTAQPLAERWRTVRDAFHGLPDPAFDQDRSSRIPNHRLQAGARPYPGHTGSTLDEPAKTLKAGVHGVPGGENMLQRADGSVRYFTVRESARLQTFPDEFVFDGSWTETMRQLGNAVPVKLAEILARELHSRLDNALATGNGK